MSAPKHKQRETLNFTGFSAYYGPMSAHEGYGGFDYSGFVEYMNTIFWQKIETCWCETGYQNVAAATGASSIGWIYEDGTFTSANPKETFDLKSFVAAAAWSANMEWQLTTYSAAGPRTMDFYVTDAPRTPAQHIKVAKSVGNDITGFNLLMLSIGTGGNTCTDCGNNMGYGAYGYQMAFGDMRITWNGKIPHGGHELRGETPHARHHVTPNPINANAGMPAHHAQHGSGSASHHGDAAWHTQLLAFGHDPGNLTAEFKLPQTEHFGI